MTILSLLVILVVVGLVLYALGTLPIDAKIMNVIRAVVVVLVCVWLLEAVGLLGPWHVGTLRFTR